MDWMAFFGVVLGSTVVAAVINVAYNHWAENRWSSRAHEILQLMEMLDSNDQAARERLRRLVDELIARGSGSELWRMSRGKYRSEVLFILVPAVVLLISLVGLAAHDMYKLVSLVNSDFSDPVRFALVVALLVSACFLVSGVAVFFASRLPAWVRGKLGSRRRSADGLAGERAGDAPDPGEQGEKVDGGGE